MSHNNARLQQLDLLAAIGPTGAGRGFIKLESSSKLSCQAIYDVTANPAAAAIATADITLSSDPTNPSTFLKVAHGLVTGMVVRATTAGTLAVPLVLATDYYVIAVSADRFALATSYANAIAGTRIAITNVGVTSTTLTPSALSASLTFQASNDGVNWTDIQSSTAITADGSIFLIRENVSYAYFGVLKTLTGGNVNLKALTLVLGDAL